MIRLDHVTKKYGSEIVAVRDATFDVAKGDFVMVPPGTGHWFSAIDGTLVVMSLHLPVAAR